MHIVIFVTIDKQEKAQLIASKLLEERLIACANIICGVESFFRWEGRADKAQEVMMMMKTAQCQFSKIVERVKQMHPYQVPEIIALPIIDGNKEYLNWIDASVTGTLDDKSIL